MQYSCKKIYFRRGHIIITTARPRKRMRGRWICIFVTIIHLDERKGKNNIFFQMACDCRGHLSLLLERPKDHKTRAQRFTLGLRNSSWSNKLSSRFTYSFILELLTISLLHCRLQMFTFSIILCTCDDFSSLLTPCANEDLVIWSKAPELASKWTLRRDWFVNHKYTDEKSNACTLTTVRSLSGQTV